MPNTFYISFAGKNIFSCGDCGHDQVKALKQDRSLFSSAWRHVDCHSICSRQVRYPVVYVPRCPLHVLRDWTFATNLFSAVGIDHGQFPFFRYIVLVETNKTYNLNRIWSTITPLSINVTNFKSTWFSFASMSLRMGADERWASVHVITARPRQTRTWASFKAWISSHRPCACLAELSWSMYIHSMKLNMTIKSSTRPDQTITAIESMWQQSGIPMNLNCDAQPVSEAVPLVEY